MAQLKTYTPYGSNDSHIIHRKSLDTATKILGVSLTPNREFKQILEKISARTSSAFVEYRIVRSGTQKFEIVQVRILAKCG